MNGYTKLFGSLINSTVWRESKETKIVWVTMMAMCDRYGMVESSVPGLADAAKVSMDECLEALKVLSSPDPWSRTKDNEGRRVEEVEGGWRLLNHAKYRDRMSAEDRLERQRVWQAEYRKRKKKSEWEGKKGGAGAAIKDGFGAVEGDVK